MNTEMVAPSQLHRNLQRAKDSSGEERKDILASTLRSGNLAVIRRIPLLLSPLFDEEKEMVAQWAEGLTQKEDVSDRDFAFHLMASCGVPGDRVLEILENNRTFSRSALEHIQQVLGGIDAVPQLEEYLFEVAEKLLTEERIPSRDRGRHMLMTLAKSDDHWEQLAFRFASREISDLRQRVMERFVAECPEGRGLTIFCDRVVGMCLGCIINAAKEDVHKEASHMHWVITCLQRQGKDGAIREAANVFSEKFGTRALPRSVKYRIESALSPEPPTSIGWDDWAQVYEDDDFSSPPIRSALPRRAAPLQAAKPAATETNAQMAARLGITKRQAAKLRAKG